MSPSRAPAPRHSVPTPAPLPLAPALLPWVPVPLPTVLVPVPSPSVPFPPPTVPVRLSWVPVPLPWVSVPLPSAPAALPTVSAPLTSARRLQARPPPPREARSAPSAPRPAPRPALLRAPPPLPPPSTAPRGYGPLTREVVQTGRVHNLRAKLHGGARRARARARQAADWSPALGVPPETAPRARWFRPPARPPRGSRGPRRPGAGRGSGCSQVGRTLAHLFPILPKRQK